MRALTILKHSHRTLPSDVAAKRVKDAWIVRSLGHSQAMIKFEPNGTILSANEMFLASLGYTLEEVQGQHHQMFVAPDEAAKPAYREFWSRLDRGEFQAGEFMRIAKGGREVWIQATYSPVLDDAGDVVMVVKLASDITERKVSQLALKDQSTQIGETMATGVGQMSGAISEIARNVARTADLAQRAEHDATDATTKVNSLHHNSTAIGHVVTTIQSLAAQTNLLALNATIEAARAGESGRGFAVVANEVKTLASQTSEATGDIRASIEAIQSDVSEVVAAIDELFNGATEVSSNTSMVAAAIEEQSTVMGSMNQTAEELLALNTGS